MDVPGRSGSLTVLEGDAVYDDLVLTAQCIVENTERYAEIAAYLKGSGKVTFANRPEGYYEARITNQIPFEKILRGNPHHGLRHGRDHPHGGHDHYGAGGHIGKHNAELAVAGSLLGNDLHERRHQWGVSCAASGAERRELDGKCDFFECYPKLALSLIAYLTGTE